MTRATTSRELDPLLDRIRHHRMMRSDVRSSVAALAALAALAGVVDGTAVRG